jgi:hypothetical protein
MAMISYPATSRRRSDMRVSDDVLQAMIEPHPEHPLLPAMARELLALRKLERAVREQWKGPNHDEAAALDELDAVEG